MPPCVVGEACYTPPVIRKNAGISSAFCAAPPTKRGNHACSGTSLAFEARPPLRDPLQVGQGRRFYLTAVDPPMLAEAAGEPPANIWVSVTAPRGEILRISGSEVLPYLRLLAAAPDAGQQTSGAGPA